MNVTSDAGKREQCVEELMGWLHKCWQYIEDDRVGMMQPDPFYKRGELLTPEIVESVVAAVEQIYVEELEKFPEYHRKAQGISAGEYLVPPGFDQLPYVAKRALVEGCDKILQKYRV